MDRHRSAEDRTFRSRERIHGRPISQVPFDKDGVWVDGCPMTLKEAVEHNDRLPRCDELFHDDAADIACTTRY